MVSASRVVFRSSSILALVAVAVTTLLHQASRTPLQLLDPSSVAAMRMAAAQRPGDGALQANLALSLLRPSSVAAPNTNEDSLYGPDFTLGHPDMSESRRAMERALRYAPNLAASQAAHQAVLMAEGHAEEAIQPGRRAVELAPTSAAAYIDLARSHLLAACAQGCSARMSLRREKQEDKKRGKAKSALEQREAQAEVSDARQKASERGKSAGMPTDRGSLRAGAMWRLMEAGRLLKTATEVEPTDTEAKRLHKQSRGLITLDAFKVLNTEQVLHHGECSHFFGQELDGNLCDKKRHKYEGPP